ALEKSINRDQSEKLAHDLAEARKKRKKGRESPKTPPGSAHIPTVNLRQGWWKPFEEEQPTTPEPAWSIRSSDVPVPPNNWASTLAVDDPILRHNISKPLPLGGPPGQVTIQSDFFFNKDLEYLRYGSKGRRPALSISKIKVAYYPDVGLEQMAPDQFWIEKEYKYDIAAMYDISHWWFQKQRFYIVRHTSEGDRSTVRTHMRILSVVRIKVFSMYGYDYMKKIVLHRADLNEHVIAKRDFKVQMMMRFNEIHKFSDGTLQQIVKALDYRVKEFRINRMNPGLNTRFWTKKDIDRCNAFMFAIQRRLRTRRIFRNLESFVGGCVREGDYRLLKLGFNSLVHSLSALSALRRFGLRTASTAVKPCQGDSSEFYLITSRISTVAAAGQKGRQFTTRCPLFKLIIDDSKKTFNTTFATLTYAVMIQDRVSMRVRISQPHKMAMSYNKDD
nr:hypothetical protein [Tanacetum cinerariifolium]